MKWQIPVSILSSILFIWGILPFLIGRIRNVGVWVSVAVGLLGLLSVVFSTKTEQLVQWFLHSGKAVHITAYVFGGIVALLVVLFVGVSVLMVVCANKTAATEQVTVVVPGALLHGDRPSLMLSHRLKAAARYMQDHPQVPCVVSGGQGEDEDYTEAWVMRNYLIECGIDPSRIYMEDKSTNTIENMQFTHDVIQQNNLPKAVVIATQEFHQYRCGAYAGKAGLAPVGTATCATPWHLLLCYWVREFAGICRMWLLGY